MQAPLKGGPWFSSSVNDYFDFDLERLDTVPVYTRECRPRRSGLRSQQRCGTKLSVPWHPRLPQHGRLGILGVLSMGVLAARKRRATLNDCGEFLDKFSLKHGVLGPQLLTENQAHPLARFLCHGSDMHVGNPAQSRGAA